MDADEPQLKGVSYESFILALSILSLANLAFVLLFPEHPSTEIIRTVDAGLCIVFLLDFCYRLMSARRRRDYFVDQFGWLDFIGSLPLQPLRIARLYRVVSVGRALRPIRGHLWRSILRERAGSTLFAVLFLVVLLLEIASSLVLTIEVQAPRSNIRSASDALWWTWVSVTTVGYGDRYPVTDAGRFIGALTLAVGVGLVGALTGFLANSFLRPDARTEQEARNREQRIRDELEEIRGELRRLRDGGDTAPDLQAQPQADSQPHGATPADSHD
jgi:voltage-gated potassium channel